MLDKLYKTTDPRPQRFNGERRFGRITQNVYTFTPCIVPGAVRRTGWFDHRQRQKNHRRNVHNESVSLAQGIRTPWRGREGEEKRKEHELKEGRELNGARTLLGIYLARAPFLLDANVAGATRPFLCCVEEVVPGSPSIELLLLLPTSASVLSNDF